VYLDRTGPTASNYCPMITLQSARVMKYFTHSSFNKLEHNIDIIIIYLVNIVIQVGDLDEALYSAAGALKNMDWSDHTSGLRYSFLYLFIFFFVGRCGAVGNTLAFGYIGHGFESEHRLFSHHSTSAFNKLRSLAKCSLDDSVRRLL